MSATKDAVIRALNMEAEYLDQKSMVQQEADLEDMPCMGCSFSGLNRCQMNCEEGKR
jgi:hypothetical protein